MQDFRKLRVWRKAHELVLAVHRATQSGRRKGSAALVSQLRRAAISIPANIAEGCGHSRPKELARFLQIAMASANEMEYHLLLARDLGLISSAVYERLDIESVQMKRMLASLIQRVRESTSIESGARNAKAHDTRGGAVDLRDGHQPFTNHQ